MFSEDRAEAARRLQIVEDHLRAITVLMQEGAPCTQVLRRFRAVRSELRDLKIRLRNCQVKASKNVIQYDPCVDRRLAELRRLIDLYTMCAGLGK